MPTRVDLRPFLLGNVTGADANLAQPKICGGSKMGEKSTVDSMGGNDGADQPKKTMSERFFTSASKLWCVGGIFKTIAGWFNIHIEDSSKDEGGKDGVKGASKKTQAKSKEIIKKVFENDDPSPKQIKKAKDAFRTLSLAGKLAVIRNLLSNENCKSKLVFSFIEMLGKGNVASLKKYVGEELDDDGDAAQALKKCKAEDNNDAVKAGVSAYLAKVQDQADGQKLKLIRKTFDGKTDPNAKQRQAALDAFRALESPVSQMVILVGLLDSSHISLDHVAEFAMALPKGTTTKADSDDEDDDVEEVSKAKGKKGAKKKEEVEDDEEEDGDIQPDNLQGRLLTLIKEARAAEEAEDKDRYKESMAQIKNWKKTHPGKKLPKEVQELAPEKPAAFNNLKGYFIASASKDGVREAVREQAQALLKELQAEQDADNNDEE